MARYTPVHSGYSIINGSGSGSNADRIDVWVEYALISQSVSSNSSYIHVYFYTALKDGYSSGTYNSSGLNSTFTVDGSSGNTVSNGSYDFRDTTPMLLASYGGYVYHNSDGTGYAYVSGSFTTKSTYISGGSVSGTIRLPTIYREISLTSAPNFTDEENPTIYYSNPAGTGATTLQACISLDGSKDDIAYRNVSKTGSSYTFNLTEAERTILRQATKDSNNRTVKFYLKAIIGGVATSDNLTKTLTIVNANPTVSNIAINDANAATIALTGSSTKFIKYHSTASVSANYSILKNADLEDFRISCGDTIVRTIPATFENIESNVFTVYVKDSRNNVTTIRTPVDIVDYVKLTCNIQPNRPTADDGDLVFEVQGNYFNDTFGVAQNTLSVKYRYKTDYGSYGEWKTLTPQISGNTYTASDTLSGLDYQTLYNFEVEVEDKLTKLTVTDAVKSTPVFDWSANDFNFNVPVTAPSLNGMRIGENKILWEGGSHMNGGQTIELNESVSAQPNGIVLIFSGYDNSSAVNLDSSWSTHFVPKEMINLNSGGGQLFMMAVNAGFSSFAGKYLYIYDDSITGHATNTSSGTNSGITFTNSNYVLRYVVGV